MKDLRNSLLDQHHDLCNLSIPQISHLRSRSGSPDLRLFTYDRIFDTHQELLSPKMNSMARFDAKC
jgi:hypothetical protein